jgi:hypothetical protein
MAKNQKFVIKTFKRSEVNLADYNPRQIKNKNKANLSKALKKHGLVTPLVLNLTTMNLCGGHQRIQEMDILEDYPKNDYELDFSCIEVDEYEEKAINLMLNNKNLQGDFSGELLNALSMDGFDLSKDGFFPDIELKVDFGIISKQEREQQTVEEKEIDLEASDGIKEMEQAVGSAKETKQAERAEIKAEKESGTHKSNTVEDYTVTLIFNSAIERNKVMEQCGLKKEEKLLYYSDLTNLN